MKGEQVDMIHNKFLFYVLSFTWGLPMTLIGCIVAAALWCLGKRHTVHGYCYFFKVGKFWGGVNLGIFCLIQEDAAEHTIVHESGHAHQNCLFGPFMIIIAIASVTRYWYRNVRERLNNPCNTGYYDIWFEKQADEFGTNFFAWYENNTK